MAHNLAKKLDGTYAAAYAQHPAWHDLGKVMPGLMTTPVALKESGIVESTTRPEDIRIRVGSVSELWEAYSTGAWQSEADLRAALDALDVIVPDYTSVVEDGSNAVLGIHQKGYAIEEFSDAFLSLGAAFGEDAEIWETMVKLRHGKVAAGCIRFPEYDRMLVDGSHLLTYIAAYTSHDGSYALTYTDTNIRQECENKLRATDAQTGTRRFSIRHTSNKEVRKAEAVKIMTFAQERVDAIAAQAEALIIKKLSDNQFQKFLDTLVPVPDEDGRGKTMAQNRQEAIRTVYLTAPDQIDIKGTAWGAVQAVGHYVDHNATYRNSKGGTAAENKFIRTVLVGNTIADRAVALLS